MPENSVAKTLQDDRARLRKRAKLLAHGKHPWDDPTRGAVARGFVSKIGRISCKPYCGLRS